MTGERWARIRPWIEEAAAVAICLAGAWFAFVGLAVALGIAE